MNAMSLSWEGLDTYAIPPTPLIANVVNKILSQDNRRVAQQVVVSESGDLVISDTPRPAQPSQSSSLAIQREPTQRSAESESPCLAP